MPGSLCQPHNFTIGDTISTDYSLFQWTLASTNTSDPFKPFIPYTGITLNTCDVVGVLIEANVLNFAVTTYAAVRCLGPELPILIKTSFTPWGGGPGSYDLTVLRLNLQDILDLPPDQPGTGWTSRITGVAAVNSM